MIEETATAEWQGFALSHFAFDIPNAYRAEIGRLLAASDAQVSRALEDEDAQRLGELRIYRNKLRELMRWPGHGLAPVIPKPPGYKAPEPTTPAPEPEHHFADLMLADETIDDAKARLSQRLRELRHYLIAPEIKVNEDGSVGLTAGEQAELQDLERRQTLGRWLEA
jgi:hypothetical protein